MGECAGRVQDILSSQLQLLVIKGEVCWNVSGVRSASYHPQAVSTIISTVIQSI